MDLTLENWDLVKSRIPPENRIPRGLPRNPHPFLRIGSLFRLELSSFSIEVCIQFSILVKTQKKNNRK